MQSLDFKKNYHCDIWIDEINISNDLCFGCYFFLLYYVTIIKQLASWAFWLLFIMAPCHSFASPLKSPRMENTSWLTPFEWLLSPNSMAATSVTFLSDLTINDPFFFSVLFCHNNAQRGGLISDSAPPAATAADVSKKYIILRYQPHLSLSIFTLLMAVETGSGSCWYFCQADRGTQQGSSQPGRVEISAQHSLIRSAGVFWALWSIQMSGSSCIFVLQLRSPVC